VFEIVQRRYWYFLISTIILIPGLFAIARFGLPRSIDFAGGAIYEVAFDDPERVTEEGLREVYRDRGIDEPQVVEAEDPDTGLRHQIRSKEIDPEKKQAIAEALRERFGGFTELRFESVGPSVSALVTRNATIAVAMAALGIMLYMTLAFHSVPHPIRYGTCAIIAMLHDVGVVVGVAAIMGRLYGWEIDALFLTALLTVIGFSVHDSIVVFDRIRENVGRMRGQAFERVVNHSIIQTLDRSINTQLTAIFTLVAIYVYSQGQLKRFIFWLIIGIVSGTYSSIFNAAPLLVVWENREWRNWFGRGRGEREAAA
jgi:preprotein translocase subunit SecF